MAALPFLIAAASLGYAVVFPDGTQSTASSRSFWKASDRPDSGWSFGFGMVLGMGISSALSYEMRRWRIWERVRLSLLSLMLDSDTSGYRLLDRYRKPSSVDDLDGTPLQPNTDKAENKTDIPCGVLHEIVSPDWTLTSKMAVDALTLFPGSEIVPVPALGVEFYYVVRGKGKYLKDNEEPADIGAGECFVVDPKCCRGFKVKGKKEMVILRVTDTVLAEGHDITRRADDITRKTMAMISAGLNRVEGMVKEYVNMTSEEKSENL